MQKWEYNVATWAPTKLTGRWQWSMESMKNMGFIEGLDFLGAKGWEMCGSSVADLTTRNSYEYLFKRPIA